MCFVSRACARACIRKRSRKSVVVYHRKKKCLFAVYHFHARVLLYLPHIHRCNAFSLGVFCPPEDSPSGVSTDEPCYEWLICGKRLARYTSATYYNTLQYTATRSNILRHTATYCNVICEKRPAFAGRFRKNRLL